MESSSDLKFQFDGNEDANKFFYVYENVLTDAKTDEEKADRLAAQLNAEAFRILLRPLHGRERSCRAGH